MKNHFTNSYKATPCFAKIPFNLFKQAKTLCLLTILMLGSIIASANHQPDPISDIDHQGMGTFTGNYTHSTSDHVWLMFNANAGDVITVNYSNAWETYFYVYNVSNGCAEVGNSSNNGCLSPPQAFGPGFTSSFTFNVTTTGQYVMQMDAYVGGSGAYSVTVGGSTAATVPCTASATVFTSCPSNINTTSCANVSYTATATNGATLSYSFTGATTASGSGTGSGSSFNAGVTNVTITATSACSGNATCSFTVTGTVTPATVTSNGPICSGNNAEFYITGGANEDVVYTINSNPQQTVTLDGAGMATVTIVNPPASSVQQMVLNFAVNGTCSTALSNSASVLVNPSPAITPTGSLAICAANLDNQTVQLTGTPSGGIWGSTNSFATVNGSGLVTGAAAGTANITYTEGGCTVSKSITVNPVPMVAATANPNQICLGDSTQLTATSATATNFFWSHGQPNGSYLKPINNQLYIVEATDANGCRSTAVNVNVIVNPNPTVTATGATACANQPASLSASATGGTGAYSFAWAGPAPSNTNTSTNNPYNFALPTPADSGSYSVIVSDNKGCKDTATATLTIHTLPVISGTLSACADGTTQLTATNAPATPTAWVSATPSVATVDNSGLVTGLSAGTTDITYTDANGCSTTVTVTINSLPVITGTAVICADGTTQLSATNTPATSPAWVSGTPTVATVDNAGLVTAVSAGSTVITYTDINGCDETYTITVNPVPTITGTTTICADGTTQLTGSGTAASWTSSNTGVATVDNAGLVTSVYTGTTQATTIITYTDANGCDETVTITVNPVPVITGPSNICHYATVNYTATNTPATPTAWSGSPTAQITVMNNGDVTGANPGNATITYVDINGCTATQAVTVSPLPSYTPVSTPSSPICAGTAIVLTGSGGAASYQFYSDAALTTTVPYNSAFVPTGTATYYLLGTDALGCKDTADITVVVTPTPSVDQPADEVVCNGSATNLVSFTTTVPGTVFNWTNSDPSIGLAASGTGDIVSFTATNTGSTPVVSTVTVTPVSLASPVSVAGSFNFDGSLQGWTAGLAGINCNLNNFTSNTWGLQTNAFAGANSIGVTTVGGEHSFIMSPLLTFAAGAKTISFKSFSNNEAGYPCSYDVEFVEISTDGGTSWTTLNGGSVTNLNDVFNDAQWRSISLPASTIATTNGRLRFRYDTGDGCCGGSGTNNGWYIDDVSIVSGGAACTGPSKTFTYTVNASPAAPTVVNNSPICAGFDANFTVSGTAGDEFTYNINGGSATLDTLDASGSATITVLGATANQTLNLTQVRDTATSCVAALTTSSTVTVNPLPVISGASATCNDPLLTIQLTATNAPAATTSSTPWLSATPGVATVSSTGLVTPVSPGTTLITYTDVNGCIDTQTITIHALPVVTATAVPNQICAGESTVTTATMTSGAGTPAYFWSHGQANGATITPTGGFNVNYTVYATDANGCSSIPVVIGVIVNPLPIVSASDVTVCDGNMATFTASSTSGTPGYTYAWSGTYSPVLNATPFGPVSISDAGPYKVIVTDTKGCKDSTTKNLIVNPNPVAPTAAAVVTPICSGNDANFTISGVAGYVVNYKFGAAGTVQTATIGAGGTVGVTDPGVTANSDLYLTQVTNPTTSCFTNIPSAIAATVVVNALPVTPTVSAPANVCSGSNAVFTIMGTPTNIVTYNVVGPVPSSGTATIGAGGSVTVTVPGITATTVINLTQVTDAGNSCSKPISVSTSVGVWSLPVPTVASTTAASCAPGCDGTATMNTTGGASPYNYAVTGSAAVSGNMITGICNATSYIITATDNNGCMGTVSTTGTIAPNPTVTANDATVCLGKPATFTAVGTNTSPTTGSFMYAWTGAAAVTNGIAFTPTLAQAGNYTVTATDSKGCQATITKTLTVNQLPSVTATATLATCTPGNDGVITAVASASPSAGSGPSFMYTRNAGTPQSSGIFTGNGAGTYTITVADGNACTATTSVAVNTANGPQVTVNNAVTCIGGTALFKDTVILGSAAITSTVYTPTASFGSIMDGVAFTPTMGDAGTYTVTVTDANGCSATAQGTLTVNPLPTITGSFTLCGGGMTTLVGNGTPATTNPWTSSAPSVATVSTTGVVTATLVSGTSTTNITYTNSNGCTQTQTVTVHAKPVIAGPSQVCRLATISLAASGTPAASSPWVSLNPSAATVSSTGVVTGIAAGTTQIVYTTTNGCKDTFVVTVNPLPQIMATAVPFEICKGDSTTLTAMNTATSPSTAINFFWTHLGPNPSKQSPAFNATYFVFGTDANGCSSSSVAQLVQVNQLPTVTASNVTICDGDAATLTAMGTNASPTTGSFGYSWSGSYSPITNGVAFNPAITDAGIYSVTATDSKGCTATTTATLTINPLPVAATVANNSPICNGQNAVFTISGTASNVVTYTINGGAATTTTIGAGGTATVTVTAATANQTIALTQVQNASTGCVRPLTATSTVTVNPLPTAATVANNSPICSGQNAVFTISGTATNVVTYTINGGAATTATIGAGGTVAVTVTAATVNQTIALTQVQNASTGCITPLTATSTITVNPLPTAATVTNNSPICSGQNAVFTISGTPTNVVSYTINGGAATTATIGAGGTVAITVTAATANQTIALTQVQNASTGCVTPLTATSTVTVNPLPVAATVATNSPICSGQNAVFTISGTAANVVTYTINGGTATTATIGAGGTATVTVTAATANQTIALTQVQNTSTGCVRPLTVTSTVTVNPLPSAATVVNNGPICSGFDAVFTLSGTATHVVTYTINGGAPATKTLGAGGTATVSVLGATANQTIALTQVQNPTTGCVTPLTATSTVTVNPLPVISGTATVCLNQPTQLTATNMPATSNAWMSSNPSAATVSNTGLVSTVSAGATVITYTDINGCTAQVTVTVNPLPVIMATASPMQICVGDSSQLTAMSSPSSPTVALNFFWTHGKVNGSYLSPIANTTYFVYGTDANGCSSSSVSQLVQVNQLPTVTASNVTICAGQSATLTAVGANTAPTTGAIGYSWSGAYSPITNGVAFTPTVAQSGPYTVTVSDSKGCTKSTTVSLTVNPTPTAPTLSTNSPICAGGTATFTISGGAGNMVSYTINGGSAAIATIGAGGTVAVNVANATVNQTIQLSQIQSGATNCVTPLSSTATVTVNPLPVAATVANNGPICTGSNAVFTISGTATNVVTYTINGGTATTATIGAGGTVTVTVTAATANQTMALTQVQNPSTGCVRPLTTTSLVTVNAKPTVTANTTASAVCAGSPVTLTGGGASTYTWNNSVTNNTAFTPTATATYTVTGTDGNGCTNTASVTVTVNAKPTVTANTTAAAVCAGNPVTLTGGGASTYTWNNSVINGTAFTPTATATYTVTGTDGNGCTNTATVSVTVNPLPVVGINATATSICAGDMVALSGTGASTYSWNNSVVNATPFTPAATNTYTVTGTDGNGCTATSTVTVTVNPIPAKPAVSVTHPICDTAKGTINVSAPLGATLQYSINGTTYQSSPNFTNVSPGTYNVSVRSTTAPACVSADSTVTVNLSGVPCGPNVTVGVQNFNPSIAEGGTANINYFVSNVGTSPTNGMINIIISKPSNGTLVLTPPAGWNIISNTAGSIFLQSTNVIQPGLINRVTIPGVYVHDNTNEDAVKSSNIKAQAGSGGEVVTNDNEGQTFIQIN